MKTSDDVIEVLVGIWRVAVPGVSSWRYREVLQDLVTIARAEQMIGIDGDLNKVSEIQEGSKDG